MKKIPSPAEIESMTQDELAAHNREMAKKIATQMVVMVWLKITIPRVAAVCAKHAIIRAAKNL